jgi:hypothetical protein
MPRFYQPGQSARGEAAAEVRPSYRRPLVASFIIPNGLVAPPSSAVPKISAAVTTVDVVAVARHVRNLFAGAESVDEFICEGLIA